MHWQTAEQIVDIASWLRGEDVYPEGKRVKRLVYCPVNSPYQFLEPRHSYLFKMSPPWAPEQFWVEIFAYWLSGTLDMDVPAAFVAVDSHKEQVGALIRWFLKSPTSLVVEDYQRGGDLCQKYLMDFDRKSGAQHNFQTLIRICDELKDQYPAALVSWTEYWAKIFLFDALLGNTDRHQDNWGIIVQLKYKILRLDDPGLLKKTFSGFDKNIRFAPVFDNGSSMGYEITANKFKQFAYRNYLKNYVEKGKQHMKWSLQKDRQNHLDFLQQFLDKYPANYPYLLNLLSQINLEKIKTIFDHFVSFEVPSALTTDRANFMLNLFSFRLNRLLRELK